jgi:hypothetical protein
MNKTSWSPSAGHRHQLYGRTLRRTRNSGARQADRCQISDTVIIAGRGPSFKDENWVLRDLRRGAGGRRHRIAVCHDHAASAVASQTATRELMCMGGCWRFEFKKRRLAMYDVASVRRKRNPVARSRGPGGQGRDRPAEPKYGADGSYIPSTQCRGILKTELPKARMWWLPASCVNATMKIISLAGVQVTLAP